jgi:hypothetical protein
MNMKENSKAMDSLLGKLDQLEMGKEIQLTKEEAELYQVESLDELPIEDQMDDLKNT